MSFHINLFVLIIASISIAVLSQYISDDCMIDVEPTKDCLQYIPAACINGTFIVDRLYYGNNCSNASLFWGGPMYNMTVLFKSHLLNPYKLCMSPVGCANAFRTTDDGHEVPVEWNPSSGKPLCFAAPHGGRPTMKFRFDAGDQYLCYGTYIKFFYKL